MRANTSGRSAILFVVGLAFGILNSPATQAAPRYALKVAPQAGAAIANQIDQRIVAQLGLGVGLQSSVLKSQLQILDALRSKVGVCIAAHHDDSGDDDDDDDDDRVTKAGLSNQDEDDNDDQGDDEDNGGASIKLLKLSENGPLNIDAVVEIYYDNECKKVFIHAPLTVHPTSQSSISFTEVATFYSPVGAILGKLTVDASGAKSATDVNLTGTGNFVPSNGGVRVQFGLACAFPTVLTDAKPFVCNSAVVASFNAFKFDLGLSSTLTTKVTEVGCHSFVGSFKGIEQLLGGPFGKLGVSVKDDSVSITGPAVSLGTITIAGTERLGTSPSLVSWTVTDAKHDIVASVNSAAGSRNGFNGILKDTITQKTLATFSVDQSGSGWILFSNNQKVAISGWIITS